MSASESRPWRKVALGEIFHIGSSKRVMQSDWRRDGVPFYRAREIVKLAREGFVENDLFISEEHYRALCEGGGAPQPGDLMVSAVGTLGACYVVKFEDRFYYKDASVLLFRPKNDLDPQFVRYAFFTRELLSQVEAGEGATVGTFTIERARKALIPFPSFDEQKRIVAKLDQAFAALDRALANVEANAKQAAELLEVWIRGIFSGSEEWPEHQLADLCENLDRQRVPITKSDREPGDIPYYGASGVVDYVNDFLFDEDLLLVSEDGANLLARTYPIAFSITGKAWVNNHAHVLRFSSPVSQEFVRLYLNSISLNPYVTGMAQPKLNQSALNAIPVPTPPIQVQAMIVEQAGQIHTGCQRAVSAYEAQAAAIAALRQSLLQAAFSGQLS